MDQPASAVASSGDSRGKECLNCNGRRGTRMATHNTDIEGFLSRITVTHGPVEVVAPFFLKADECARARGIRLSFASFEQLLEVNAANQQSWYPLVRTFDPRFSELNPKNSFCVIGRDQVGEVVAVAAGRRFDWGNNGFAEEASSLKLFYQDPDKDREPGERCVLTEGLGSNLIGSVGWGGGAWYRPDYRGIQLPNLFSRIVRMYGYAIWGTDFYAGMMSETVLKRGLNEKTGHAHVGWEMLIMNAPVVAPRFALVWMSKDELLDDARQFLASFPIELVRERRTQNRG
jgi:hypothetical protein